MTIASIIAASLRAQLTQDGTATSLEQLVDAVADQVAASLRAAPVTVFAELVQHLCADVHTFRVGPRTIVSLHAGSERAAAQLALTLGAPTPSRKQWDGREWVEASTTFGGVELDISSEHQRVCVCRTEERAA
jgi:hypothetical protein